MEYTLWRGDDIVVKKIIGLAIITTLIMALNPIGASAEWKQDNRGWWYTEGNSYATGWRNIDGKWYYFSPYCDGYMLSNTSVDGYYLNKNGAWIDDSNFNIKASKAEELVRNKYYPGTKLSQPYIECCDFDGIKWTIRAFEDNEFKTTNIGWYYVDKNTGSIKSEF